MVIVPATLVPIEKPYDGANGFTVVLGQGGLPIPVRRAFFLGGVPEGAVRGDHAHRKCHQLFLPLEGVWTVEVQGSGDPVAWTLNPQRDALWVPPMNWVRVINRGWGGGWIAVLASEPYDPGDYCRDRVAWEAEVR